MSNEQDTNLLNNIERVNDLPSFVHEPDGWYMSNKTFEWGPYDTLREAMKAIIMHDFGVF